MGKIAGTLGGGEVIQQPANLMASHSDVTVRSAARALLANLDIGVTQPRTASASLPRRSIGTFPPHEPRTPWRLTSAALSLPSGERAAPLNAQAAASQIFSHLIASLDTDGSVRSCADTVDDGCPSME